MSHGIPQRIMQILQFSKCRSILYFRAVSLTHLLSVWSNEPEVGGDINKVFILPVQALIQGSSEN
jgi:hypothetical protein